KRRAAGKLAKAKLACYGAAAGKGVAVDPACLSKATAKFAAAVSAAGTCPDGGSAQSTVEMNCVSPAVSVSGGIVTDVCPSTCGIFVATWGSAGSGNGQFDGPKAVATDLNGNVFVTDTFNNRIEKFDNDGVFLAAWGGAGTGT